MDWLAKCHQEAVSPDKKLEIIMMSLADMCHSMTGLDGNQIAECENQIFKKP